MATAKTNVLFNFTQSGAHLTIENTIQLIGLNDVLP